MTEGLLNAEKLVAAYLREQPAIQQLKASVLGQTPDSTADPWVRITLLDAENRTGVSSVDYLVAYSMQVDCYAGATGGQAEAFALTAAVRALLIAMPSSDDVVVTDVENISMIRVPDPDLAPTRERYVLTVTALLHP